MKISIQTVRLTGCYYVVLIGIKFVVVIFDCHIRPDATFPDEILPFLISGLLLDFTNSLGPVSLKSHMGKLSGPEKPFFS